MKKFSLYLLLAALLLIQVACEKTPDQPINNSTQEKSDVTETGGNGTIIYEIPGYSDNNPVPCSTYVTELVVNNNINDWTGSQNSVVIGTMTVTNTQQELIFTFKLSEDKIDQDCYISKATGNAWVIDAYNNRYVPPGVRTITETHTDVEGLTTVELRMPYNDIRPFGSKTKDYSFYCDDILALMGSIEVCCPGGNLGNGSGSGNPEIIDGIQILYAGNDDQIVGTVEVSIVDGFLRVEYNITEPNMPIETTHFLIAPSDDCPFPESRRIPPGQMPFGSDKLSPFGPGTFSNNNQTWIYELPLEDFISYIEATYDMDITDICEESFCISTHASVGGETAYGGINKVSGTGNSWYRYFGFSIECGGLGEGPTCESAWSLGNSRYCYQLPNVEGRYWYWVTKGYTFCCD